ncbi:MAG: methyltransferase FkbM family [Betaproteobacteria bacterium]|nr:methyltransferase FkbM family [Betaproteobacteria bacterium]
MNTLKTATIGVLKHIFPERMKNSLLHLSFHLAQGEFQKFAHEYCFAPDMRRGLSAMAARGFTPRTIVDVGAFEAGWSRMARQIWPDARLFMIEPNNAKTKLLRKAATELNATLMSELLGAEDGQEVPFYVMESGSSILAERSGVQRSVEARCLRTLDALLPDIAAPGLLKIDAQGYELQILRGASRILPEFEAVLLEVAIIEINEGAPLLHDVVTFMKTQGFVAYDILEIHRRPLDTALNQVDIIFIREQSRLIADKRHY